MTNVGLVKYVLAGMRHRKLRSWLTVLSVFIGITAITALLSFGNGISSFVDTLSQQMGKDKLIIQPRGFGFGPSVNSNVHLTKEDLKIVEGVRGVSEATGVYFMSGEIQFGKQKKYAYIIGSDFQKHERLLDEIYNLHLDKGTTLKGSEKAKAVFGYNYQVKDKIFSDSVRLRDNLLINSHRIEVVGFYQEVGNPQDDSNINFNAQALEDLFDTKNYQFLLVRAAPEVVPSALAEKVSEALRRHRNEKVGQEDFQVQTFEQVIATFNTILSIITTVVLLIAFISVIVAAVNIMNTMYTSILERTKDIGVFKAIGSRNRDILFIFMLEAGLLSTVGGALGIILGYIIATVAGSAITAAGYGVFSPLFSWQLAVGSLLFAFCIGILSGLLPAYQASKLKPVDALRYE